ncbi:MAG TPA: ABC transporter permease [Hyphomicrobiales bacterium]|nr:ABC transporter permease [Hyphomicrobiales bacterium]
MAREVGLSPVGRRAARRGGALAALGRTRASGFALVVLLLVLWELSARLGWVQSRNWPPFSAILVATWHGLLSGEVSSLLAGSLARMVAGYAIGSLLGIAFGLCLASVRTLDRLVTPLIEAVRPLPIPAIIPPLILFLGLGDALKIFAVALSSFFPVFVNSFGGVKSVDAVLIQTARTFRVGPVRTLLKVVLPAALPSILAGLRISLALALVVTVVAEMIAGSSGIGYYIILTQYALKADAMYGAILCLAVIGYALNRGFIAFERRLLPWYHARER